MTNSKICIVGDRHFGIGSDIFLESQINFDYKVLMPYLKNNEIDTVIFPGDIFDNRKSLNVYVKNKVYDLFCEYEKLGINIYISLGNHDTYFKNTNEINSLKWLEKFNNVKIYGGIEKTKIKNKTFLFVGWQHDLNEYINYVTSNDVEDINVCVGHFDIIGAKMSGTIMSNIGLTKNYVMRFPLVFSGHYHSMSIEKNNKSQLIYVGTPYQLTRGDKNESKYFFVLDLENMQYNMIENIKSIRFVDVFYPEKTTKEETNNNIIDLHIPENVDIDELETYKEEIRSYEPISITPRIISKAKTEDKKEIKFKSLKELFFEYVTSIDIEDSLKEKTTQKINNLFDEFYSE